MKKKSFAFKLTAFVAVVVVICIILLIPPVTAKVSAWTGVAASKIAYVAQTIIGTGVGIMLISFGVAALSAPIVAFALIVIGLSLLAYSLWPLFKKNSTMKISGAGLNKVA